MSTVAATRTARHRSRRRGWSGPYGPLRPSRLLAEVAVLVVAETLLLRVYGSYDSSFHWAAHFLVGLIAAVAWLAAVLLVTARPARGQVLMVLPFHLYAMFPDLLYRRGLPHGHWSDAFVAHIRVHYLPGGDRTWLALAASAVLAYAVLLSRWVAARTTEADSGMAPGIGIGGSAVWTPQRDPATTVLGHGHSGAPTARRAVVLLHGLGGTGSSWARVAGALATSNPYLCVLVPDLLGHGCSRGTGTSFGLAEQAAAVSRLLDEHALTEVLLVGHSYGAAVAAATADTDSGVTGLVLVCPPAFTAPARTAERLSRRSWLARRTVAGAPAASVACGAMCLLRPVLTRLAPRAVDDLPPDVARGGLQHSYPAYRAGLRSLLDSNPLPQTLRHPRVPTLVVLGDRDETVPAGDVLGLPPAPDVDVRVLDATHQLPLDRPETLAELITSATAGAGPR